jgi:hypothetical protein
LMREIQSLGASMYQGEEPSGGPEAGGPPPGGEDVVEGEVVD